MKLPINEDLRQHISLSTFAHNTILSDLMSYDRYTSLSGIANAIIRNSFDSSKASLALNADNEALEIDNIIESCHFKSGSSEEKAASLIKDAIIKKHRDELSNKMDSFSKDINIKIRLQKETVRLLEEQCKDEITYYRKSLTGYLKALLEDYARQSAYKREYILFKDIIDRLNTEIIKTDYLGSKSRVLRLSYVIAS